MNDIDEYLEDEIRRENDGDNGPPGCRENEPKEVEEPDVTVKARALRRAAQLYVAAVLTDGEIDPARVLERGAFLEGMAIEYAAAANAEKRSQKKKQKEEADSHG